MKKILFLLFFTAFATIATAQRKDAAGACQIFDSPNTLALYPEFQNPQMGFSICPIIYDRKNNVWYDFDSTKAIGAKYVKRLTVDTVPNLPKTNLMTQNKTDSLYIQGVEKYMSLTTTPNGQRVIGLTNISNADALTVADLPTQRKILLQNNLGGVEQTTQDVFLKPAKEITKVATIALMQLLTDAKSEQTVFVSDADRGGQFILTPTTSPVNNITIFSSTISGNSWTRQFDKSKLMASWSGINTSDAISDVSNLQKVLNLASLEKIPLVKLSQGKYIIDDSLSLPPNVSMVGMGKDITTFEVSSSGINNYSTSGATIKSRGDIIENISILNAAVSKGDTTLTLTSVTGLNVGDWIVLVDKSSGSYYNIRPSYNKSEAHQIRRINGNVIALTEGTYDNYTVNANTVIHKYNTNSATLKDFSVKGFATNWITPLVLIQGKTSFTIENVKVYNYRQGIGMVVDKSLNGFISNTDCEDIFDDNNAGYSYGLVLGSVQKVTVLGGNYMGDRHAIATGGESYPIARFINYNGVFASTTGNFGALDMHEDVENSTIVNSTAIGGISISGKNNIVNNNIIQARGNQAAFIYSGFLGSVKFSKNIINTDKSVSLGNHGIIDVYNTQFSTGGTVDISDNELVINSTSSILQPVSIIADGGSLSSSNIDINFTANILKSNIKIAEINIGANTTTNRIANINVKNNTATNIGMYLRNADTINIMSNDIKTPRNKSINVAGSANRIFCENNTTNVSLTQDFYSTASTKMLIIKNNKFFNANPLGNGAALSEDYYHIYVTGSDTTVIIGNISKKDWLRVVERTTQINGGKVLYRDNIELGTLGGVGYGAGYGLLLSSGATLLDELIITNTSQTALRDEVKITGNLSTIGTAQLSISRIDNVPNKRILITTNANTALTITPSVGTINGLTALTIPINSKGELFMDADKYYYSDISDIYSRAIISSNNVISTANQTSFTFTFTGVDLTTVDNTNIIVHREFGIAQLGAVNDFVIASKTATTVSITWVGASNAGTPIALNEKFYITLGK